MSLTVHNLMAYNPHFFRPQPVAAPKKESAQDDAVSFQDILNQKMKNAAARGK